MAFPFADGAAQLWLVLLEVGEEVFVYVLDSVAAEVSSSLKWNHVAKSKVFGIELLSCGRIVSCDFLLLDTKWNLSAACPLPVLEAGSSEQLSSYRLFVWSGAGSTSFCQVVKWLAWLSVSFSAWNTGACLRGGCRWAIFSAFCHIHIFL